MKKHNELDSVMLFIVMAMLIFAFFSTVGCRGHAPVHPCETIGDKR